MATSVITAITAVFTAIAEWISGAVTAITPMFYAAEGGLTFLGTLAVTGLAFSVVFLNFLGQLNGDVNAGSTLIAGNSYSSGCDKTISSQA